MSGEKPEATAPQSPVVVTLSLEEAEQIQGELIQWRNSTHGEPPYTPMTHCGPCEALVSIATAILQATATQSAPSSSSAVPPEEGATP